MAFWLFGLVQGLGICMGGTSLIGFKDPRLYGLELLKGDCRSYSNGYSRKQKGMLYRFTVWGSGFGVTIGFSVQMVRL